MDPSIGLTTFLIRNDQLSEFRKAFPPTAVGAIPLSDPLEGYFIPFPSVGGVPAWVEQVGSLLDREITTRMRAQSPGALLVVTRGQRTFVVTFGHAWQKLEDEWLERDFGRRVALNSIASDGLVEIRAEQVFARWHVASDRAPKAAPVDQFGVEFDRDLVASVEGVPTDKALGKVVRGSTSLRVQLPISSLAATLDKADKLFASTSYRKRWPEIDNLKPVRDASTMVSLENRLDGDLASGDKVAHMVLFTPTHRRDDAIVVDSYVFGRMAQSPARRPYLTIDSWLEHLAQTNRTASVSTAKSTAVHLLDESHERMKSCSVFDCLGCEVSMKGKTYVLSSGVWYEVVASFLDKINDSISKLAAPTIGLPPWNGTQSEGEYNAHCGGVQGFLKFDAKMIPYGGGHSQFEFCDVLHPHSRTMFFAKIVSKSSGMSHLVEQVRRTAELTFSIDPAFRSKVVECFQTHYPAADRTWLDSRPRAHDWNLCLVSLGRSAASMPFFAKCGLVKLANELTGRGHPVSFLTV